MNQKRGLARSQERRRTLGLRILARIIARHYLEHPDLYPVPTGDIDGGSEGVGKDDTLFNADVRDDGGVARKEAAQ